MDSLDPSVVLEGWKRLNDMYYRKYEVYKMQWTNVNLNNFKIVGASCGGALGVF